MALSSSTGGCQGEMAILFVWKRSEKYEVIKTPSLLRDIAFAVAYSHYHFPPLRNDREDCRSFVTKIRDPESVTLGIPIYTSFKYFRLRITYP